MNVEVEKNVIVKIVHAVKILVVPKANVVKEKTVIVQLKVNVNVQTVIVVRNKPFLSFTL